MKKMQFITGLIAICILAPVFQAGAITSLTILDILGTVDPASPANGDDEAAYINAMIALAPGASTVVTRNSNKDNTVTRVGPASLDPLPTAVNDDGMFRWETPENAETPADYMHTFGNGESYQYLFAKYGQVGLVWYIGNLDLSGEKLTFPEFSEGTSGNRVSHFSLYNRISVPDGGWTLILLGSALSSVGLVRRWVR